MKHLSFAAIIIAIIISSCSGSKEGSETQSNVDKGVGPVTSVTLGASVDMAMANEGQQIFVTKCSACHKLDAKYVGPALKGVTNRRAPEWIMNMILNPEKMTKENEAAKQLLGIHMTQMTNQNIAQPDARKILEYFRSVDK